MHPKNLKPTKIFKGKIFKVSWTAYALSLGKYSILTPKIQVFELLVPEPT